MSLEKNNSGFPLEFIASVYCVVAEADTENETVKIHYAEEGFIPAGVTCSFATMLEDIRRHITIDKNGVCDLTAEDLRRLCRGSAHKRRYCCSFSTKNNIIDNYVVTLCPVDEKRVYLSLSRADPAGRTITLMMNKSAVCLNLGDILYVGYGNHSVEVHLENECKSFFSVSFLDAAGILLEHENFIRCYKNCIVNMDRVVRVEGDSFVMDSGDIISIPKRRSREIRQAYEGYLAVKYCNLF